MPESVLHYLNITGVFDGSTSYLQFSILEMVIKMSQSTVLYCYRINLELSLQISHSSSFLRIMNRLIILEEPCNFFYLSLFVTGYTGPKEFPNISLYYIFRHFLKSLSTLAVCYI